MSRPASGDDAVLMNAREAIALAQTVEQLRQAQAVVLPLDYAMSLTDTAQAIGVSPGWAGQLRRRFMHITADWGQAAKDWKEAMNQFAILYEDRFAKVAA